MHHADDVLLLCSSLSGLSPFMGDNDTETMNNILHGNWDFDSEAFENVSEEAKDFVSKLLIPAKWYNTPAYFIIHS